ncbi:MAG: hypothetical protein ABGX22_20565 [Pirellulaceae bacterium]
MPIEVTCQCGKRLKAKDEMAGKRVKCPNCSQPLQIPASVQAENNMFAGLFDEEGLTQTDGPVCPSCKTGVNEGAVLCIQCGYNFEMGEKTRTNRSRTETKRKEIATPEENEAGAEVKSILRKAAESENEEQDMDDTERYGTGVQSWLFALVMVVLLGNLLGGMYYYHVIYAPSQETSDDDDGQV